MNKHAIVAEGLGKEYRLGAKKAGYKTLRDVLTSKSKAASDALLRRRKPSAGDGRKFWALKDVSFNIERGDVLGIVGRNGAGKSTLLKILSRITDPTTGRAKVYGRIGSLLEVGSGFHPELTGRENILLNGVLLGMKQAEIARRFDAIVAFAEVERFVDTPVKHYSSGMYLRLAFAVAAHLEPDILLVDEVLAVGDVEFQKKCLGKMKDFSKAGSTTVVFVSHNLTAVKSLCRSALLLRKGELVKHAPVAEVISDYLAASAQSGVEQAWTDPETAPGNEDARLLAVRLVDEDGLSCNGADISEPITIEVDYRVLQPGAAVNVSLSIYTFDEVYVLASPSIAGRRPSPPVNEPGIYKSRCTVPGNIFNEGQFMVSVLLVKRGREIIAQADRAISFELRDSGELRGGYFGYWGGVVRPDISWDTIAVDEQAPRLMYSER